MNAVEIEAALSDLSDAPFNVDTFPYDFLAAFGHKDTVLNRLRSGNTNASDIVASAGAVNVLLRNHIHLTVCAAGAVHAALQALLASPASAKAKAKFVLATDGVTLEAQELASGDTIACDYTDFANHFGFFLPLAGISTLKEKTLPHLTQRKPRLGRCRSPQRDEPLHGAAGVLLFRRGHRHF
jgi:hypothetical protein